LKEEYNTVEEAMKDMLAMGMDINHYIQAKYGEEFRVQNLAMLLSVMTSTFLIAENISPETYTRLLRKTYNLLKLAEALKP
jgi:tryptophanyl-tRNA synthetase